jgi:hypothetical protein
VSCFAAISNVDVSDFAKEIAVAHDRSNIPLSIKTPVLFFDGESRKADCCGSRFEHLRLWRGQSPSTFTQWPLSNK